MHTSLSLWADNRQAPPGYCLNLVRLIIEQESMKDTSTHKHKMCHCKLFLIHKFIYTCMHTTTNPNRQLNTPSIVPNADIVHTDVKLILPLLQYRN